MLFLSKGDLGFSSYISLKCKCSVSNDCVYFEILIRNVIFFLTEISNRSNTIDPNFLNAISSACSIPLSIMSE